MEKYIKEISEIQNEYYNILKPYESSLQTTDDFRLEATLLVEDVKKYWFSKSANISLMLDSMTDTRESILLCGAIYLGVEDNEEFIFSTFGSYHFLNDPFIRMESFLFGKPGKINPYAKEYFLNAYKDTLLVLTSLSKIIIFSPLLLLYRDQIKDYQQTLDHGYWGVISSLLKGDYSSIDDIKKSFSDTDSIEKSLSCESLKHLIFIDHSDSEITLSQRIDKYFQESKDMFPIDGDDEIEKFVIATYAQTTQVLEILLMCLYFNVIPFVRYEITFHYLMLLSGSFSEQKEISLVIIKTIIIYLFYHNIDRRLFDSIDFIKYSTKMRDYNLLEKILLRVTYNGDSFFKKTINEIVCIIQDEFKIALSNI